MIFAAVIRSALAQDVGDSRIPVWQLGASMGLSATDNAQASPSRPQSGVGTEFGFGAHVNLPYRRLRGYADLSLVASAKNSEGTTYGRRSDLRAGLNAELIESHAFLDLSATYGIQLGSVFDSPERALVIDNDNRLQSANVTVSPALRARLGDGGRVEARLTNSTTKVKGSDAGDIHSQAGELSLESGVRPRSSTWKGQAYGAIYDPDAGRRTTEALVRGDLGWAFDAETVVSIVAGREGNDFDSTRRVYNDLYGLSLDYRPNERTRLYAEALNRFFGTGFAASLSYRLPQFALMVSSSRTNSRPGLGLDGSNAFKYGSVFDVLYLQLATVEPDANRRRVLVLDILNSNGIDPTLAVNSALVTSGVLLVENHVMSATWSGVRNSLTLAASGGNSRRIDSLVRLPVSDQFNTEERIDQLGSQLIWIRRLSPSDDLSTSLAWNRSEGSLTRRVATSQSGQLRWTRRIGAQASLSAGISHQRFEDSAFTSYRVNVVSCEYQIRF